MSIFKSTLNPTTAAQLKARESVVETSGSRSDNFLKYTTGKNSWIRMTSFVNYNDSDDLSRKYILEGGTLYNNGYDEFTLRAGVGKQSGAYASNLDINTISGKKEIVRPFGLRPMPGIVQASVTNKSAYGSLREATIEFLAWDKHQLEELELLFMRPGYTVFLEWGWSQYLDHGDAPVNTTPDTTTIKMKSFDLRTLNPFDTNLTDEIIYNKIDEDIEKSKGNYDAMLGYVKNFSWQLLPNGGFQCTTVLISRGEVLSSLKASATPNFSFNTSTAPNPDQVVTTMFENILLNIIGSINDAAYSSNYRNGFTRATSPGELYTTGSNSAVKRAEADAKFELYKKEIKLSYPNIDLDNETCIKYCDGGNEGTAIEYISMDSFIALLNAYLIPKQGIKNITNIEIPGNTPCLASEDSVSIDPTTCLIKNKRATFIADDKNGFDPYVLNKNYVNNSGTSNPASLRDFLNQGTTNLGSIGNIYVSINKILTIFRNNADSTDGINVLSLLQKVLDAVSFSLGGINNFQIHSTRGTAQIIDIHYLESGNKNDKFKFNLIGLSSICRDVKINSRIFAEQSTMIGIGAAAGSINNLGDIYTSTQQQFNKGLTDRVLNNVQYVNQPTPANGTQLTGSQAYYYNIFKTLEGLKKYTTDKVLGIPNDPSFHYTIVPQPSEVTNAGNALKTIHYQLNGKDVNFKALIPFELEITLDGIGGFVIGQIFTIDNSILPQDYYNKNLGFIITGVSHKLQNNDWVTELKTQICLLDTAEELAKIGTEQKLVKSIVNKLNQTARQNTYLVNALADFLVYITVKYVCAYDDVNTLGIANYNNTDLNILSDSIKAESYLVGSPTSAPSDRRYINQLMKACSFTRKDVIDFLDNWYDVVAPKNLPDFPKTKKDFITQTSTGSPKLFDVDKFVDSFLIDRTTYTNLYTNDPFITQHNWDTTTYNQYKELFDKSYLGAIFADPANGGLPIKIDTNPKLPAAYPIKLEYPNKKIYQFYNTERPADKGLNIMRNNIYQYFQRNPVGRGLDLSLYLSSAPIIDDVVNIIP